MSSLKTFGNAGGFSLAEVMVASAILGAMSLALMTMIQNQNQAMNFMEDRMSLLSLRTELSQTLLIDSVCKTSLEGIQVADQPVPLTIKNGMGQVLFSDQIDEKRRYDSLEIESLSLRNVDVPDHVGSGWVEVVAKTKRLRKGTGPLHFRPAVARIRVNVDSDRVIRSCDTGRVTALDCGSHPHGEILTSYMGQCPDRFRKRDICIAGIWLLYEKIKDPDC